MSGGRPNTIIYEYKFMPPGTLMSVVGHIDVGCWVIRLATRDIDVGCWAPGSAEFRPGPTSHIHRPGLTSHTPPRPHIMWHVMGPPGPSGENAYEY